MQYFSEATSLDITEQAESEHFPVGLVQIETRKSMI